ncbi:MAG: T9SS type A sorting domain-containing protein [Candidatus Cloacimonadales bacterium]|nr:T9SS type A sorting domain-containing protein [Candidatus Cloacimonadales bacterium]
MWRPCYSTALQFDGQNNLIRNYDETGCLFEYNVSSIPDSVVNSTNCISEEFFNDIGGPIAIYATSADDFPYFTYRMVEEYMDLQFEDDYHKLGYLTRESWDRVSQWFNVRAIKEMYIGYTLFGDPSMDVWCAEAEQLVTIYDRGTLTFTALNSSGTEVDAEIVVTNSSGSILGKGASPYVYEGKIEATVVITSNAPNYIQASNTWSELEDYSGLPYTMDFEDGIDYNWEMHSSNSHGRILVTDQYTPHSGSMHLTMDSDTTSTYVTNEAWLHLNLEDESRVICVFWWKEFSDETHTTDGVYFSDDGGTNFTKVYSLTGGTTSWQDIELDVDALCTYYSLDFTDDFVIKFQQYDDNPIPGDGFAFDDISVYSDYATLPYSMDFNSNLDHYWETESSNQHGRIQITGVNSPYEGRGHLTMDTDATLQWNTNKAMLYLNLSQYNHPEMSFWWKEFTDDTHTTDGVYFSDDAGANFTKVYSLTGGSTTYQEIELDIEDLASTYSLDLTAHFVIKFQQYDDNPISGYLDNDGFAFDDLNVVETGGGLDNSSSEDLIAIKESLNNFPNPFNPSTTISFSVYDEKEVSLSIFNMKGQKVKTLLENELKSGDISLEWKGDDDNGKIVSSGIYFYKLRIDGKTIKSNKCLLLK